MKKRLSLLLVTVLLVASFAACTSGGDGGAATTPATETPATDSGDSDDGGDAAPPASSGDGDVVINITFRDDGIGEGGSGWQWMAKAASTFDNPDVTVNIAPIQASEGDYFTKIALQLNSDSAPNIVFEDTFQLPNDVAAGFLTDLTPYVADYEDWNNGSFYESLKNGVTVDGKVYGIPYNTDTRGLWYNKEIFAAAGLPTEWEPKNWDEIFSALEAIKAYDSDLVPFWCNSGVATGEATSMQTYEMLLYATGGRLMDAAEEKWVVKSDNIIEALNFIDRIYKEEFGPPLSLVLNGQASNTSAREYLPEGKLAVSLDGSWITGNYLEGMAAPWPEYGEVLGFAAFPTNNGQEPYTMTLAGGWGLAIPERSQNKDVSWEFIKHAMDPDTVYREAVINMGSITTRTDVTAHEDYASIPFRMWATEFLASAEFRPKNDLYSSVSTCIQEMVESVASGTATPEAAMEKYATDVTRIVGEDNVVEQ